MNKKSTKKKKKVTEILEMAKQQLDNNFRNNKET